MIAKTREYSQLTPSSLYPNQSNHSGPSSHTSSSRPALRVLMAEDNKLVRESISLILREAGYLVDTAENGAAAVEKQFANEYDVILMDCQMPIMDGFEATTRIRNTENASNRIPIIAFTGHDLLDQPLDLMACGMDGFLPKPVDATLLIKTVRQVARRAIFSPIAC